MSQGPILQVDIPATHPAVIEAARGYFREKLFGPTQNPSFYQWTMHFPSYEAMIWSMRVHGIFHEYHWH